MSTLANKIKVIFANFAVMLFITIVLLTVGEIIFRKLHPYNDTNPVPIIKHPTLPYRMLPNTNTVSIDGIRFLIDNNGLRDIKPKHDSNQIKSTFLVVGDSTTFGYGVPAEETFVEKLQFSINSKGNGTYSFINAGHSGFNLKDYAILSEMIGPDVNVNALIIGVMGNDFTQTSLEYVFRGTVGISENSPLNRFKVPENLIKLLRNSALYLTVGNAVKGFNFKRSQSNQPSHIDNTPIILSVKKSLQKIKSISQQINVPVYIFYFPTKVELLNGAESYPEFNEILLNFAELNSNIFFYDLTNDQRIISNIEKLFFKTDWVHPNNIGHSLYCDVILDQIKHIEGNHFYPNNCS